MEHCSVYILLLLSALGAVSGKTCNYDSDCLYYCCDNTYSSGYCCSSSITVSYWGAGSISGLVAGLVFFFVVVAVIVICCRRRRAAIIVRGQAAPAMGGVTVVTQQNHAMQYPGYANQGFTAQPAQPGAYPQVPPNQAPPPYAAPNQPRY